ncbi:MAG: hypothetical protein IH920_01660 [Chloroflexi bacterium]|nr:hypothetical protein [Chloroflexota bacterium]
MDAPRLAPFLRLAELLGMHFHRSTTEEHGVLSRTDFAAGLELAGPSRETDSVMRRILDERGEPTTTARDFPDMELLEKGPLAAKGSLLPLGGGHLGDRQGHQAYDSRTKHHNAISHNSLSNGAIECFLGSTLPVFSVGLAALLPSVSSVPVCVGFSSHGP